MSAMTREPALLKKLTEQAETHAIELRAYEATVANLNERIAGHNDALAFMKDNSDRIQQEFIARINAANERIRQMEGGWIPVSERLPNSDVSFLAITDCAGDIHITTMRLPVLIAKNEMPDGDFIRERVTHWMPLPAIPKKEGA